MTGRIKNISVIHRVILILIGLFIFMKAFYFYMDPRNKSGIYLSQEDRILTYSSPSSWLGDGEDYDVYQFTEVEMQKLIDKVSHKKAWKKCPIDETSLELISKWAHFMRDNPEVSELIMEADLKELLPVSNDGYYLLLDRSDSQNQASKEKYGLMNYSIFILNLETKRLYYIASDM